MKVCLINPPLIVPRSAGVPFVFQPLGLLYVAAGLEKRYEVRVVDAVAEGWKNIGESGGNYSIGLSFEDVRQKVEEIRPDVVGISVQFSINEQSALRVASEVKVVDKKVITILGGPHVTVRPLETLSSEHVDIAVIGEGEITMQELMDKLRSGASRELDGVSGIGYKKDGVPVLTGTRPLIEDLDLLPFPARHLAPMEKYFDAMRARRGARKQYTFHEWWTSIITSRGCTYHCNFCSIHLSMGRKFRKRSPENVIEEIKQVVDEYSIRHINFEDDNLTLDKKRAESIFDLMVRNKFNVTWSMPNGVRVENVDEAMVKKMKASGCRRVFVAPESGVQRVVSEIIGKNLDLKKIDNAVALFKKHGIIADGSFVMGFIGETKKDMWSTIRYILRLKKLGLSEVGLHIATPYYGTRLYEEAKQKGFLRKEFQSSLLFTGEPLIETPEWSAGDLRRTRWTALLLLSPGIKGKIAHLLLSIRPLRKPLRAAKNIVYDMERGLKRTRENLANLFRLLRSAASFVVMNVRRAVPKPELIVFEVTDACNSRCRHCYIWKQKPTAPVISPAEVKRAFSDGFFSDLKLVLLTGGEPILRNDIDDLIRAIHEARPTAQISLSTNALLPDKVITTVTRALEKDIRLNVGVSLDAVGERHDQIRGVRGNFERVDRLLMSLARIKEKYGDRMGSIVVGHTLSNLTLNTVEEVKEYARKLNVGFVTQLHEKFSYYHNVNRQSGDVANYRCVDNAALIRKIKLLPKTFYNMMLIAALKHKLRYKCAALRTFFLLKCGGFVSPCLHFDNATVGNITSQPVSQIWQSEAAHSARGIIKKCRGCSNTWAIDYSMSYWPFPFWKELIALVAGKLFRR